MWQTYRVYLTCDRRTDSIWHVTDVVSIWHVTDWQSLSDMWQTYRVYTCDTRTVSIWHVTDWQSPSEMWQKSFFIVRQPVCIRWTLYISNNTHTQINIFNYIRTHICTHMHEVAAFVHKMHLSPLACICICEYVCDTHTHTQTHTHAPPVTTPHHTHTHTHTHTQTHTHTHTHTSGDRQHFMYKHY